MRGVGFEGVVAHCRDEELHRLQLGSIRQHRCRQADAPPGGTAYAKGGGIALAAAVGEGVAAEVFEVGGEVVVAATGDEGAEACVAAVLPVAEAVAFGGRRTQYHRVAETVGTRAGDSAAAAAHGCGRNGATGAEGAGVGLDADKGGIGHVVGSRAVASYATHAGVERSDGEVAVVGAAPTPVEVELVGIVVAIAHEGMASRGAAA